jgi:ketosteroid isomerase-like protein
MNVRAGVMNAAALVSLIGVTVAVRADDKKDIAALYNKVAAAMIAKNVDGIMATGTKDFTYTEAGKTMTGSQVSAQMKQQFQMLKGPVKCKMTVVSCKITGKTADVNSTAYSEMQISGQDGKAHTVVTSSKSKDVVVKTGSGWLMKSVNIQSNKMTMDGKPYDPTKPMADKKK